MTCVRVKQFALYVASQQRLMLMLSVQVHQQFAELLELLHGHRAAIDEGP